MIHGSPQCIGTDSDDESLGASPSPHSWLTSEYAMHATSPSVPGRPTGHQSAHQPPHRVPMSRSFGEGMCSTTTNRRVIVATLIPRGKTRRPGLNSVVFSLREIRSSGHEFLLAGKWGGGGLLLGRHTYDAILSIAYPARGHRDRHHSWLASRPAISR